jgi:hypothetical protein
MTQAIAVDFDGVLHDYTEGWKDGSIYGEFMPGAVSALTKLMARYAVFVHTTRSPRQVAYWIEDRSGHAFECEPLPWWKPWRRFHNQQGLLLVTNRKLPAVAYIDDRAVKFVDWDQALAEVLDVQG